MQPVQVLIELVEGFCQLLATAVMQLSWFDVAQMVEYQAGLGFGTAVVGIWAEVSCQLKPTCGLGCGWLKLSVVSAGTG